MSKELDRSGRLLDATLATIAYANIFDFALDETELHRDLVFVASDPAETNASLDRAIGSGRVTWTGEYLTLAGRDHLAVLRSQRKQHAAKLWPIAHHYGRLLAAIPYVRMVGVTGSLAADNPPDDADVDFILVSTPGRLWLVRAASIAVVRLARLRGRSLCPNYLLTTRALTLRRRDLYAAHEALQIQTIYGHEVYRDLVGRNDWLSGYLPNRTGAMAPMTMRAPHPDSRRAVAEFVLGGPIGTALNRWEERRKVSRFRVQGDSAEFSSDVCEGHFLRHRGQVLARFESTCAALGVDLPSLVADRPHSDPAAPAVSSSSLQSDDTTHPVRHSLREPVVPAGPR